MKIAGLVVLVLVFVGVPVVSYVVIHGHQLGMLQDGQKSKAGVDLVSAGDTSLPDESTTDEIEVDTGKNTEKPHLTPEEMQKLMQESGANDDGPGPGYDGGGYIGPEATPNPASVFGGVYTIDLEGGPNCNVGKMDLEINFKPTNTPPYLEPESVVMRDSSGMGHPSSNARFDYESTDSMSFIFPFISFSGDQRVLRGRITSDGRTEGTQTYHDALGALADGQGTFSGRKKG